MKFAVKSAGNKEGKVATVEKPAKAGVECPRCGCVQSKVLQTRKRRLTVNGQEIGSIRRERECDYCRCRFWTSESTTR